jgi:hypothetical protein
MSILVATSSFYTTLKGNWNQLQTTIFDLAKYYVTELWKEFFHVGHENIHSLPIIAIF